jgi:hypothetical protein
VSGSQTICCSSLPIFIALKRLAWLVRARQVLAAHCKRRLPAWLGRTSGGTPQPFAARRTSREGTLHDGDALLTVIGIIIGLAGAVALSRILATELFEVSPRDPATFIATLALTCGGRVDCRMGARATRDLDRSGDHAASGIASSLEKNAASERQ